MSKLVRATDPTTGREFTTSEAYAKRKGLKTTTKDAVDQHGRVIRDKGRVDTAGRSTTPQGGKAQGEKNQEA